ncbi:patatin family protein [Roseomonas terrae]|uniref:Patatin family protein n=1 Tax=Neoroseomonas terrae TaxID=424799 RepID=A0ABS5EP69_9PROT|nr:patatin-like phospholipase family protein [Neoroseomonas terrae]MBR0652815.1 patatin family protein [Neoroseomonas terrae]
MTTTPGRRTGARLATWLVAILVLAGCGNINRLDPPPLAATPTLSIAGIDNARFWPDADTAPLLREIAQLRERQAAGAAPRQVPAARNFLALSGGGDNGAFGAGLLVGWTASGRRPTFDVVTGISAGALIAPFAFLGPAYDPQLREVFTEVAPHDVLQMRSMLRAVLFGEALADTSPLYRLIERHVNPAMMAAIAAEYARGRLLLIGTTNLDLGRPVLWNIGAIAASGHPDALELFRRILLASASIPGAFPPVLVDVDVAGRAYQEMHVDGGAALQMFLYPPTLELREQARGRPARERTAWIVRNGRLDTEWATTNRSILNIASRSASTLLHYSAINDITRIFLTTRRDGVNFRLAYIGPEFDAPRSEPFETAYMRALFDYGYRAGQEGRWTDSLRPIGSIERNNPAP